MAQRMRPFAVCYMISEMQLLNVRDITGMTGRWGTEWLGELR